MLAQASNSAGLSVHVEAGIGSPSPKSILSRSVHPMKRACKDGARKSERSFFCAGLGATKAWLPEPLLPGRKSLFLCDLSALFGGGQRLSGLPRAGAQPDNAGPSGTLITTCLLGPLSECRRLPKTALSPRALRPVHRGSARRSMSGEAQRAGAGCTQWEVLWPSNAVVDRERQPGPRKAWVCASRILWDRYPRCLHKIFAASCISWHLGL